jgi:Family of unknown function (DUF6299)
MRPRWRVTSLATVMAFISAVGAMNAHAQQTGGEITVDPVGTFDRQGQATISGTYVCEETEDFAFISGNLTQPVGRLTPVRGEFFAEATCTGDVGDWTATVQGAGLFRGGGAVASASLMVCAGEVCVGIAETTEDVRLRG